MQPRIAPVAPPYSGEIAAFLKKWMPPGSADPLLLFRVMSRHRAFTDRMRPLGAGILGPGSGIAPRERELLIARVCARCGCEYEWGVHVATLGAAAGLSEELRAATVTAGTDAAVWTGKDRLLVALADSLHDGGAIPDGLWEELAAAWSPEQLIELIVIVGWYHLISFLARGLALPPEPWAARWPARR
jgi:alkylhydroperoxidase family enzyme